MADSFAGHSFNLGGLSGFPFAGSVGIGAMSSHIPSGGNACIIYGPHVGFSTADYAAGAVERLGIAKPNGCCGSAIAAMNSITAEHASHASHESGSNSNSNSNSNSKPGWFGKNKRNPDMPPIIDVQQTHVKNQIKKKFDPEVGLSHDTLPTVAFDAITPDVDYLLGTGEINQEGGGHKLVGKAAKLVVIGGVLINTAPGGEDYFMPLRFEVWGDEGGESLLEEFNGKR
ncbi:hypothetical protein TrLO_g13596 [Triparma laevis f. longispina]|uniref:Limiting CO2-inducible protein B/C beta carbonyic anhydrase domain-containing protein n=1 Tax=Triparma laevis f. longispina TaxID=1714387 RepID=A0A9W7EFF7_9STRA|nr:hypothetical protein TrLO_g13596 [Triparma laevis f. longispina]